jgi:hypothetical protein
MIKQEYKGYYAFIQGNRTYILTDLKRDAVINGERVPEPNFNNTGKALVGILNPLQTLEEFVDIKLPEVKQRAKLRAEEVFRK